MENQICNKCKNELPLDKFSKNKAFKIGYNYTCKLCQNEYAKFKRLNNPDLSKEKDRVYRENNQEKLKEYNNNYFKNNSDKISEYHKEYLKTNSEKLKENAKIYYLNNIEQYKLNSKNFRKLNPEKRIIYNKTYRDNHLEIARENEKKWRKENPNYQANYVRNRCAVDNLFKLRRNISSSISESLKTYNYTKKSRTNLILGCSFEELKKHLESRFEDWMNWENYGNWNGIPSELNTAWDIDHIIPLASAKTEERLLELNHYTNLQPLCSYTNRNIKKDKY